MAKDNVNPDHYKSHPSGVECIEVTRHMNFNVGNAIKYCWRAGLKNDSSQSDLDKHIEDLHKARWYLEDEIKRLTKIKVESDSHILKAQDAWSPPIEGDLASKMMDITAKETDGRLFNNPPGDVWAKENREIQEESEEDKKENPENTHICTNNLRTT